MKNGRLSCYRDILKSLPLDLKALEGSQELLEDPERVDGDALFLHVFAPALAEFVEWTLEQAISAGKKRLYFLARDGFLMYRAAALACRARRLPLECRYLALSRYSVRTAGYHLLEDGEILDLVCVGGIDMTFEKVMRQAGLSDREAARIAELAGYRDRMRVRLNNRQIAGLKVTLRGNKEFFGLVRQRSGERYAAAMGYFEQEGLLDGAPVGLVDTGWIGTLQRSLERLLFSRKPVRLEGWYFGLYSVPAGADPGQYHGFFFEPETRFSRKALFPNSLLEAVWSAPEGMTLGYGLEGGRYVPLEAEGNPNARRMEREAQLTDAFIRAREKARGAAPEAERARDPRAAAKLARLFALAMERPSEAELSAFGELVFADDLLDQTRRRVAARLSRQELRSQMPVSRALILMGVKRGEIHESAWLAGSVTRSGGAVGLKLRFFKVYRTCYHYLKYRQNRA